MLDNLLYKLEDRSGALPGKISQYKMAPSDRDLKITKKNTRKSAVLILLSEKHNKTIVTLIKRQEYNGVHSGQISFPGGKYELNDNNLRNTAIRETFEEIGVNQSEYDIIGELTKLFIPVSAFDVYPFVGIAKKEFKYKKQDFEVSKILEFELAEFKKTENIKTEMRKIKDVEITIPYYLINDNKIWGATAMIISELLDIID